MKQKSIKYVYLNMDTHTCEYHKTHLGYEPRFVLLGTVENEGKYAYLQNKLPMRIKQRDD